MDVDDQPHTELFTDPQYDNSLDPDLPINVPSTREPPSLIAAFNADPIERTMTMTTDGIASVAHGIDNEFQMTMYFAVALDCSSPPRISYAFDLDPNVIPISMRAGVAVINAASVIALTANESIAKLPQFIGNALQNPNTVIATSQCIPSMDCPVKLLLGYRQLASTFDIVMDTSSQFELYSLPDNYNPWSRYFIMILVTQPTFALGNTETNSMLDSGHISNALFLAAISEAWPSSNTDLNSVMQYSASSDSGAQNSRFLAPANDFGLSPNVHPATFVVSSSNSSALPQLTVAPQTLTESPKPMTVSSHLSLPLSIDPRMLTVNPVDGSSASPEPYASDSDSPPSSQLSVSSRSASVTPTDEPLLPATTSGPNVNQSMSVSSSKPFCAKNIDHACYRFGIRRPHGSDIQEKARNRTLSILVQDWNNMRNLLLSLGYKEPTNGRSSGLSTQTYKWRSGRVETFESILSRLNWKTADYITKTSLFLWARNASKSKIWDDNKPLPTNDDERAKVELAHSVWDQIVFFFCGTSFQYLGHPHESPRKSPEYSLTTLSQRAIDRNSRLIDEWLIDRP
ncbi:hypothetical protein F5878DRAFT_645906 [Lentinula raphanica]|uniref:Uncharacterized protein n=1 Tax=Lentinula raphanica TaxID=153919 RepID=A0AA38U701_9AGAR|nr:hypothetical protein F5878DRAFT_645906 [Lentinula raphanica]